MSCEVQRAQVWPQSKHPSAVYDYGMSFEYQCARQWRAWYDVVENTCIRVFRPGRGSGYQFRATQGGRTGGRLPAFRENGTTLDGSVVWAPEAISTASLERTINGPPTWSADGLTVADQAIAALTAIAKLSSGEDGQDYPVTITAHTNDGLTLVEVGILKVRTPQSAC